MFLPKKLLGKELKMVFVGQWLVLLESFDPGLLVPSLWKACVVLMLYKRERERPWDVQVGMGGKDGMGSTQCGGL